MRNFKVLVKDADGSEMWDLPYTSFNFSEELNKGTNAQFHFERVSLQPIADAYGVTVEYIFSASYREIEIYDDTTKIYAGYISEISFFAGEADAGNISVSSKGFFSLLEKRFCDSSLSYTSTDSGDIAWNLINYTQGLSYGNLGITRGAHPATKNRNRTDLRYKNIADAIRGMSAEEVKDGYDFDVSPLKVFNIYYPRGSVRENIILEEDYNINTYQITKTFIDSMVNQVIVIGSGYDSSNQLVVTRNAANSYKEAFFLLQDVLSEPDVSVQATLEDKGDKRLEVQEAPRYTVVVTCRYEDPLWTDFEVGDWLVLKMPTFDIDSEYRVLRRSCTHEGVVNMTLNNVVAPEI